ncbi:hypothetical protein GCM10023187_42680 [Nibrella viscosa]|uniref:YD repeat-containing protein n=1 Tax=Nibrella viscosa TaxID=1084524 RepID=A0ABP8KQZ6_9BACT
MKHLRWVFFLLAGLIALPALAQIKAESLFRFGPEVAKLTLKGPVKRVTQEQSPISNKKEDWLDGSSGTNYTETYDQQGRLIEKISRDDFNTPTSIHRYTYTTNGQVTALEIEDLRPNALMGRHEGRIDYEYGENTYIVRDKRVIGNKPVKKRTETILDKRKRTLVQRTFELDTVMTQELIYRWDKRGYVTEKISRFNSRQPFFESTTEESLEDLMKRAGVALTEWEQKKLDSLRQREKAARRVSQKSLPTWRSDTTREVYVYDRKDRPVRQETYRYNRRTDVATYSYGSEAHQIIRQSFDQNGELVSEMITNLHPEKQYILSDRSRSKFDGKWNELTYEHKNYPSPVFRYQYDKFGNWIEQKQEGGSGKSNNLIRRIEYYE